MLQSNRNCLSYWFPKLEAAGVPVPRTILVRAPENWNDLIGACEGRPPAFFDCLVVGITGACEVVGYPAFLRTGQGSGKHNWKNCCHVPDRDAVASRIVRLVEWSEMVSFFSLPYDLWVVREMLPVEPIVTLPRYGDMPLVRELRAFVRDGEVLCVHPYWPEESIREGLAAGDGAEAAMYYRLAAEGLLETTRRPELPLRVAEAFRGDGAWSVDLLWTKKGWYVTDMAVAGDSFHFPGCRHGGHL